MIIQHYTSVIPTVFPQHFIIIIASSQPYINQKFSSISAVIQPHILISFNTISPRKFSALYHSITTTISTTIQHYISTKPAAIQVTDQHYITHNHTKFTQVNISNTQLPLQYITTHILSQWCTSFFQITHELHTYPFALPLTLKFVEDDFPPSQGAFHVH